MHRFAVHVSLACWPGLRHEQAAQHLSEEISEPMFGPLSTAHVQLVPQSFGIMTEDLADQLMSAFPQVRFRLHANVRVLPEHRVADLSGFQVQADWFRQAARISRRLSAPAYTAHAGLRSESTLPAMLDNARRCADLFGCPVGVEGLYPARGDAWLVSSWAEYRQLFESGVPYALDLSHLNILATASGVRDDALVREMLACERCIEVHVSANNGRGDWHQVCDQAPWWHPLLDSLHPHAVVFSEGNHRRKRSTP
ncbi:hypothetical protein [Sphaerotilus sp.]|uniref:hypothetical protein n=1 Tax=Sphaerotilus sp. TaxID=2093942 RepID=UPI002ACD8252|nr:hypothetical protein [Sphaerotilus sp.]MDZ7855756.1 hypothetical protein [Sphaerotilus sp.]